MTLPIQRRQSAGVCSLVAFVSFRRLTSDHVEQIADFMQRVVVKWTISTQQVKPARPQDVPAPTKLSDLTVFPKAL
jgi:hypothetical protein